MWCDEEKEATRPGSHPSVRRLVSPGKRTGQARLTPRNGEGDISAPKRLPSLVNSEVLEEPPDGGTDGLVSGSRWDKRRRRRVNSAANRSQLCTIPRSGLAIGLPLRALFRVRLRCRTFECRYQGHGVRVLLLDEGFASGALTARGLRRAGCTVDVIAATGGTGSCPGTGGTWRLAPRVGDPRLIEVLDAAVRRSRCDVVFPVTEPLQWLVWDQRPTWEVSVYPQVEGPHRAARRDKQRMSELVAGVGVTIPRQLPVSSRADVDRAVRELGLPIVIKGSVGRGGNATHVCSTLGAVQSATQQLARRLIPAFAQAHIAGSTYLAGGVFDRGRPLRFYAGVKSVQFPRRVGPAAEMRSSNDATLSELARRVFAAAEVSGLASIDLVRDARGTFHFLELNPRPWGSMEAAVRAGVDLFDVLVRLWRSESIVPRLDFRSDMRTPVFPLYLLAHPCWFSGRAARAILPDVRRAFTLARDEPALAWHMLHRLSRVCVNW